MVMRMTSSARSAIHAHTVIASTYLAPNAEPVIAHAASLTSDTSANVSANDSAMRTVATIASLASLLPAPVVLPVMSMPILYHVRPSSTTSRFQVSACVLYQNNLGINVLLA